MIEKMIIVFPFNSLLSLYCYEHNIVYYKKYAECKYHKYAAYPRGNFSRILSLL